MSASASLHARSEHRSAGLALLLGVLGVPGVTIAWDLPAGGFWIGIPLAIAAVVLGLRSLDGSRRARWLAGTAIALGAIEIVFTASWTVISALTG
jgi:hypothetical protein